MGLPIFREPSEKNATFTPCDKKSTADTVAARARSTIRRSRASPDRSSQRARQLEGNALVWSDYMLPHDEISADSVDAGQSQTRGYYPRSASALRRVGVRQQTRSPRPMPNAGVSDWAISFGHIDVLDEDFDGHVRDPRTGNTRADDAREDSLGVEEPLIMGSRPQSRRGLGQHHSLRSSYDLLRPDADSNRPLLRRVGNRSISRASRHPRISLSRAISETHMPFRSILDPDNDMNTSNGLGDRDRSVSPAASDEINQWDTFLTTITPDPHLPSASTSFTSSAAANGPSFQSSNPSQSSFSSASAGNRSNDASARLLRLPPPSSLPGLGGIEASSIPRSASIGVEQVTDELDNHAESQSRFRHPSSLVPEIPEALQWSMHHYYDCPHHRTWAQYPHHQDRSSRVQRQASIPPLNTLDSDLRNLSERHQRFTARYDAYEITEEEARRELRSMQDAFDRIIDMRERLAAASSRMQNLGQARQELLARQQSLNRQEQRAHQWMVVRQELMDDTAASTAAWATNAQEQEHPQISDERSNPHSRMSGMLPHDRSMTAEAVVTQSTLNDTTQTTEPDSRSDWPPREHL